ncbi:Hypothetical predicted protein [Podarcis lilfordi]|uniref:Uncharacterized protein n=1 Tax=Podarcis lilfordi TaxID=74358 RepID=A0AA35LGE9_9SAUR|nr:Hypothetical predicted protein [Podarcis lilfordi]
MGAGLQAEDSLPPVWPEVGLNEHLHPNTNLENRRIIFTGRAGDVAGQSCEEEKRKGCVRNRLKESFLASPSTAELETAEAAWDLQCGLIQLVIFSPFNIL